MKKIILIIAAILMTQFCEAAKYSYAFQSAKLSDALDRIATEHPELALNFIYNELDKYITTVVIETEDPLEALRRVIGFNPVSVISKGERYYVEALQHGKYVYTGRTVDPRNEPIVAATVMLLSPKDSTVITYGMTDDNGRFAIPCDRTSAIGKFSSMGYQTVLRDLTTFGTGDIIMPPKTLRLGEVKVETSTGDLYADKSVYVPTQRQKNASQTGSDLLMHMAIPQLEVTRSKVQTNTGKPVAMFINFLPASSSDLTAMRIADVKRVEYYEHPADPRLQGNPYVVNFVMQQYEIGGYFKGFGHTNMISSQVGEGQANLRIQYKKMTYDVMGWGLGYNRSHIGEEVRERFRLPQEDGSIEEFTRYSSTTSSKDKERAGFATFRAIYNTANIQASSQISGRIDRKPECSQSGLVDYTPSIYPSTSYSLQRDNSSKFLAYRGYYFFNFGKGNRLTFNPAYVVSHTDQKSRYAEEGYETIDNGASDNTNEFSGNLKYMHDFGDYGSLTGIVKGSYEYNRTRYIGSANGFDRAKSSRIGVGAQYSVEVGKLYGQTTFGWDWDRLEFNGETDRPCAPTFDISVQYAFSKKHQVTAAYEYSTWLPSPSFKSGLVIKASPLLTYTGNPNLSPAQNYSVDLGYTWLPNSNLRLSFFSWLWEVKNRYVYDYKATPEGVIRTIKQPLGSYRQGQYGVSGSLKLLDKSLVLSGNVRNILNHNGQPYNQNHNSIHWYCRATYYLGSWNFSANYSSGGGSTDGFMTGIWVKDRSDWYLSAGWSDSRWNVNCMLINLTRWHRKNTINEMTSEWYDTHNVIINGSSRAFIQLTATYTVGFGKKVKRSDQPSVSGSASSGILK